MRKVRKRTAGPSGTKTKTKSPHVPILRVIGLIAVAYVGSMAWLEGPIAKKLFQGELGPPTKELTLPVPPSTIEDRKLETINNFLPGKNDQSQLGGRKTKEEEPNFLPRVLAFVFPQFHQDALNDALWGEGFTDWDNLRKAPAKNRLGFAIPRPTELGYYNYVDIEPRRLQGELAREYDLDGFLFHHYWFYDETHRGPNLHAPLEAMLRDGYPDVPFALHWCASKWMNTWSGEVRSDFVYREPGVLQKQYFPTNETDQVITNHYNWLRQFFHHPNYIQVDGKPLFMLYQKKPSSFSVLKRLTQLAKQDGFAGLYLTVGLNMNHHHLEDIGNPKSYQPPPQKFFPVAAKHFSRGLAYPNPHGWNENKPLKIPKWCLAGADGEEQQQQQQQQQEQQKRLPDIAGIVSSFDNTPRRNYEEARLWSAEEPDIVVQRFQKSLYAAIYYEACCFPQENTMRLNKPRNQDDRFVVINAMNEWAEGMAMEPSDVYGRKFLQAIQIAKKAVRDGKCKLRHPQEETTS